MKVLLCRPQSPARSDFRFPLGLGYIAAVLNQTGHEIDIFDIDALRWSSQEIENYIKEKKYEIFALGGLTGHFKDMRWLISLSKKYHPEAKIIVGGVGFSSMPKFFMENTECDIGIMREGEETVVELMETISKGKSMQEVESLWFREGKDIISTPQRKRISDLDSVPFPQWNLFDMEKYISQQFFASAKKTRGMSMVASRGCPFQCTFCFRDFGRETYRRSVGNLLREIKELRERYDINYISFVDELFNSQNKYINDFCDRLIAENHKIEWDCRGRVDLIDEKLLKKMRRAGCLYMGFGVESANEIILKNMKKKATVQQAEKAILLTKKAGIKVACSFMIGMTGETEATLQETVDFINKNNLHKNYGFFYTTPYPGTELYEEALKRGLIKDQKIYISSLGETTVKPFINLTDINEERFSSLRDLVNEQIRKDYKNKNRFWFVEETINFYKINGFVKTLNKIKEKMFTNG